MKVSKAKELFQELTESFFKGYTVVFAQQNRIPKPKIPLITLNTGNVQRPQAANNITEDGIVTGYYSSKIPIIIDLFTNGKAVKDDNGKTIAFSNTAVDELLAFADYLNSPKGVAWCNRYDAAILIEQEVQDLSDIINDTNYEYRSRLEITFLFTMETDKSVGNVGNFMNIKIK